MTMSEGMVSRGAISVQRGRLAVAVRLPWYRSLPISCLESIEVSIDGVPARVRSVRIPRFAGAIGDAGSSAATWDLRDALHVTLDVDGRPGLRALELHLAIRIPYIQVASGVPFVQRAVARTEEVVR